MSADERPIVQPADVSEHVIVDRIYSAVIEQQLRPGAKLSELSLCEAFGVGRMRVRRALLLLASRDIVDLQSNRGAYIATPTLLQARQVFEARRAIERLLDWEPGYSLAEARRYYQGKFRNRINFERMISGLRGAGLPE